MSEGLPADFWDPRQSIQSDSGWWYRSLQPLGAGRNATVHLVIATSGAFKGLPFALKIFTRVSSKESSERFLGEATFLRNCDHPAIMRIVDGGFMRKNRRVPFFVVEYLPNTLQDAMRRGIPMVEKVSFVLQLLSALQYLNNLSPPRAHCDVKPANIFIKGRSCVLGDFGLLRTCDGNLPATGSGGDAPMPSVHRTPDLVDHELRRRALTTMSDVYQLGLVAAELFTGENPQVPLQEADKLVPVELRAIADIPGSLGRSIEGLILRMLKPEPNSRPPITSLIEGWQSLFFNAAKMARDLEGRVFQ